MSSQVLDTAAYILTSDIGLLDVFHTEMERINGLHVDEMVARLPEGKKVNPHKLARCLRLLSVEHWCVIVVCRPARVSSIIRWIEPSQYVFAPTRWALLNTPGSPTEAYANPASWGTLFGASALTEHMTNPTTAFASDVESSPCGIARATVERASPEDKNWWKWLARDPERQARFAHSMEGLGDRLFF